MVISANITLNTMCSQIFGQLNLTIIQAVGLQPRHKPVHAGSGSTAQTQGGTHGPHAMQASDEQLPQCCADIVL